MIHRHCIDLVGMVVQRNRNFTAPIFRDPVVNEGVLANGIFNSEDCSRTVELFGHFENESSDKDSDEPSCRCTRCGSCIREFEFSPAGQAGPSEEHEKSRDCLFREPFEVLRIEVSMVIGHVMMMANAKKCKEKLNDEHPSSRSRRPLEDTRR